MFTNMHKYCLLTYCYIRFELESNVIIVVIIIVFVVIVIIVICHMRSVPACMQPCWD